MIPNSRQTIHKGVNFLFTLFAGIDKKAGIRFQSALMDRGLEFSATQESESQLIIIREKPSRLEIQIGLPGPSLGQLVVIGPHPAHHGEMFEREAEAVVQAFNDVWYDSDRQILSCDATVRDLFESSYEHAFQELWVHRLNQSEDSLGILGRPVLGGGIRLVMPPRPDEERPCQIEVKIESFLRDTKKIFVETQFSWLAPLPAGVPMDPPQRLKTIDDYVDSQVLSFILGENHAGRQ